jgi:glycerol-3-phosphate acyltransferase PlsY
MMGLLKQRMKFARVLWHIVGGIIIVTMLHWNNPSKKEVMFLLGILVALLGMVDIIRFATPWGKKLFWKYLGHLADEKEKQGPNTSLFYCISSFLVVWLFQNEIAIAAIISLALGDQISSIVGNYWGRHKWKWKSLDGAVANFAICAPIMMVFVPYQLALVGALAGALVEALPIKIDDNMTIPLASGGAIYALNIFTKLI